MISILDVGPIFFASATAVTVYLVYRLSKIIGKVEHAKQEKAAVYCRSLIAQVLYELGQSNPNFLSLLHIMRDDVLRVWDENNQAGMTFLAESKDLRNIDAPTFGRLFQSYSDALRQAKGET